ncbi:MAG: DNA polymerase III subunit delta [Candidatus Gastranaerophilales bacterium]|nr:DNA polymerase III subunit delta [Candidatus Gastranaerophilales bacterium]
MAVYFFYGDEDYLIDLELQKFRSKLDANFSAMNYAVHEKLSFPDLVSVLRTQPMMFGKMMIVINCFELLSASLDDKQINEISSALENNPDMLDIFFVAKYPKEDKKKKPDSRRKIFKLLSKFNKQEFPSIPTYKTAELISWINKMGKEKGVTVQNDAANLIIENVGNDLRQYNIELDKLQLLAYPNKTITKEMVNEVCISNQDLFNLTDYIMAGEKGRALLEMRKLLDKKHPMEILAPIQTLLKKWIFLKLNSKNMSCAELGQQTGQHEFVVKKTLEKLKNIKPRELVNLRKNLTEAEYKIKTGQAFSPVEELENAIIR